MTKTRVLGVCWWHTSDKNLKAGLLLSNTQTGFELKLSDLVIYLLEAMNKPLSISNLNFFICLDDNSDIYT